ncbi:MAG: NAD(P)H-hydrate epimerase [Ferruginibacter sp.]
MKLFTTGQIRRWDEATILEERIQSVDLMERAAKACAESILGLNPGKVPVHIFCGPGNNGGDGLAITRLLQGYNFQVHGYLLALSAEPSQDCQTNLDRLKREHTGNVYSKPVRSAILFQQYPYHRRPVRHRVEQTPPRTGCHGSSISE